MTSWKRLMAVAACAALACSTWARAEEPGVAAPKAEEAVAAAPASEEAADRGALMMGLDKTDAGKKLDEWGVNIYGYVEGSFTYSLSNPPGGIIDGPAFDFEDQDPLNQINLTVDRMITANKDKFDWGFRVEQIYGSDARFTHSNGMSIISPSDPSPPDEQYDLTQIYSLFNLPFGNGILLTVGKFNTLLGYEYVNPTLNTLYSHSYLFNTVPFSHTGVLAAYDLNEKWGFQAGISRGWDQFEDNNAALDLMGQARYTCDDKLTLYLNISTGPQQPNNSSDYRTVFDFIATYTMSDQVSFGLNADYAWEAGADPVSGDTAQWYGIAGYATYTLNKMASLNGRVEWFDDQDGAKTGSVNTLYEATIGVTITPMPDHQWGKGLSIRPEFRIDYASEAFFDGGTDHSQCTLAVDVIYAY